MDIEKEFSHKKISFFGLIIIFLVFGVFGVWAVFTKVDISVQAPGKIIVKSYKKEVMHTKGGIVDTIFVHEGKYVEQGDKLLKLDTKQLEAQLISTKKEYETLLAQKARIKAELKGEENIDFPQGIDKKLQDEERNILRTRLENLNEKISDINYQIKELKSAISSLERSKKLKEEIVESYKEELGRWQKLLHQGLTDELKVYDLQRKITNLREQIDQIVSQIRQNRIKISELQNKIALLRSQEKKELQERLKTIDTKLPSLKSKVAIIQDEIEKSMIKAPSSGIVVNMKVHSPMEVVTPHKPILYIVPKHDTLVVEAHVSPLDIDKVHVGQEAEIHFASYVDPSAKPVEGKVTYISADVITDSKDPRIQYYKVLVQITPKGMKAIKENGFKIVPGMPVTVFIKAGKRSFLSYILIPIEQLMRGAFHAN